MSKAKKGLGCVVIVFVSLVILAVAFGSGSTEDELVSTTAPLFSIPTTAIMPTDVPTEVPTSIPTDVPTEAPTEIPTTKPTTTVMPSATVISTIEPTVISVTIPTVAPAPPPTAVPVCDCSSNSLNCKHFSSHNAAQACYNYCMQTVGYDVHKLDGNDNDGLACESLP